MFANTPAFSSFAVNDLAKAKAFYGQTLGLPLSEPMGQLTLKLTSGGDVFIYVKPDHSPATFTVLNFRVDDLEQAVASLRERGVTFEQYPDLQTDAQGI